MAGLKGMVLQDPDDDVRAVAAEALLPVAAQLCQCDAALQRQIVELLWDALLDVDDLSPSIGTIMPVLHPELFDSCTVPALCKLRT